MSEENQPQDRDSVRTGAGGPLRSRGERFRRTRADHRDEISEDYVEAIAELIKDRGEARVRDLAELMGVSHVTVSRTVTRLAAAGLVTTEPYRPIELTPGGQRLAEECERRHEIVLDFLLKLGVPREQAELDAEGIEHHVSEKTIGAMRNFSEHRSSG
jgi:DtxR family transcriptional regulator, manganese transport regulator